MNRTKKNAISYLQLCIWPAVKIRCFLRVNFEWSLLQMQLTAFFRTTVATSTTKYCRKTSKLLIEMSSSSFADTNLSICLFCFVFFFQFWMRNFIRNKKIVSVTRYERSQIVLESQLESGVMCAACIFYHQKIVSNDFGRTSEKYSCIVVVIPRKPQPRK